jgi:hypothetical protein
VPESKVASDKQGYEHARLEGGVFGAEVAVSGCLERREAQRKYKTNIGDPVEHEPAAANDLYRHRSLYTGAMTG